MKILMVSMFAPHFFNWTEQLKDSGHEIYWLDVFDSDTKVAQLDFVHQITGWRYKYDYPGRYTIKEKLPKLSKTLNRFNERKFPVFFEEVLKNIKPDVVHSFVMHIACIPILKVMNNYSHIKWIYSSWGSDLFHYKDNMAVRAQIEAVFKRVDYLFTDCKRDFDIATELGFNGTFLGVFPGRGGFDLSIMDPYMRPLNEKNIILVKGYQGKHGRAISVLHALSRITENLKGLEVVVFGADAAVKEFFKTSALKSSPLIRVEGQLEYSEVIRLLGKAKMYVGNSLSDGTPNSLLEAIIMGAYPIQSNPGGATSEIINHKVNGSLISNPEDTEEIAEHILFALKNPDRLKEGIAYNLESIRPRLERKIVREQVLEQYLKIERGL